MCHPHLLSGRLARLPAAFPAIVVSGARQAGKTTLLRNRYPEHDYVVFDPSIDQEDARREPSGPGHPRRSPVREAS